MKEARVKAAAKLLIREYPEIAWEDALDKAREQVATHPLAGVQAVAHILIRREQIQRGFNGTVEQVRKIRPDWLE